MAIFSLFNRAKSVPSSDVKNVKEMQAVEPLVKNKFLSDLSSFEEHYGTFTKKSAVSLDKATIDRILSRVPKHTSKDMKFFLYSVENILELKNAFGNMDKQISILVNEPKRMSAAVESFNGDLMRTENFTRLNRDVADALLANTAEINAAIKAEFGEDIASLLVAYEHLANSAYSYMMTLKADLKLELEEYNNGKSSR